MIDHAMLNDEVAVRLGQPREVLLLPFTDQGGSDGELLSSVLNAVYGEGGDIPDELLLPLAPAVVMVMVRRRLCPQ